MIIIITIIIFIIIIYVNHFRVAVLAVACP